ncbi:hypothetical protein AAG906_020893 [Vitis piasezkii]
MLNFMKIFFLMSLSSLTLLSSLTHNSVQSLGGPRHLFLLDFTSHAPFSLLFDHTSIPSPTIKNDDFSSPSRPSELAPSSPVLAPTPPSILHTYTLCPKPSSLPNNPTPIEPSSQIDPNPPPSPSPLPPSVSIPFTSLAKTPLFSPKTHSPEPVAPLCHFSRHIAPPVKLHDYFETSFSLVVRQVLEAIRSVGYAQSRVDYSLFIGKQGKLLGAAPIDTPMERGLKLSDKSNWLKDQGRYRRLVGSLIYLTVSRPDITYAVHVLSRLMHQSRKAHMEAALRVVRYLKNAPGQVSLSSTEAEYRAMIGACCELTWLWYLLKDLGVLHQEPALLHCDNKAALHIATNPVFHERTRHIEMDCHYIRDKIQDGSIITRHVSSAHQLANILTEPLGKEIFALMIHKLGVQDIHSPT